MLRTENLADQDMLLNLHLVTFLMDNYSDIMRVPQKLKKQINDQLAQTRTSRAHVSTRSQSAQGCSHVNSNKYTWALHKKLSDIALLITFRFFS